MPDGESQLTCNSAFLYINLGTNCFTKYLNINKDHRLSMDVI
jgi:hypothetical protein